MRRYAWTFALLIGAVIGANAGERRRSRFDELPCPYPCPPASPYAPLPAEDGATPPGDVAPPPGDVAQPPTSPFNEALASAGEGGTQPAASYMPGFFGDLIGGTTTTTVFIVSQDRVVTVNVPTVSEASAIKLSESESPRPMDRLYYLYNYYGAITIDPTAPLMNLHRHVIGFERTFGGGDASFGMRLPFFSQAGDPGITDTFIGDLTVITKYALVNNRSTGNVLTLGLSLTAPLGDSPYVINGNFVRAPTPRSFPVLFQPYGGYVYTISPRLYLHGFHSIVVPTDAREPTFLANDMGLGFFLYRNPLDSLVRAIIPTVEVHVNTPLNHRGPAAVPGDVTMIDTTTITTGFYMLFPRSIFGGAVGVPVGRAPNRIEALASYTWRW